MMKENDVVLPVLHVLNEVSSGRLSTREVRERVRAAICLTADDLMPLRNRTDQRIDQIIRNLKSHRNVLGNPFNEGLLHDVPRGFAITERGREYVRTCR